MTQLLRIYFECLMGSASALIKNWLLILASCLAFILFEFLAGLLGGSGFAGGMLLGLCQLILISLYYYWLSEALRRSTLKIEDLYQIDGGLFIALINTAFIFFIVTFMVDHTFRGTGIEYLGLLVRFLIFMIFNAIPEIIYIQRLDGMNAIAQASTFTREHFIEWYLPLALLLAPLALISSDALLMFLASSDPFLPALVALPTADFVANLLNLPTSLKIIPILILANWYMLFRGQLFQKLEAGAHRRSRRVA